MSVQGSEKVTYGGREEGEVAGKAYLQLRQRLESLRVLKSPRLRSWLTAAGAGLLRPVLHSLSSRFLPQASQRQGAGTGLLGGGEGRWMCVLGSELGLSLLEEPRQPSLSAKPRVGDHEGPRACVSLGSQEPGKKTGWP